MYTHKRNEVVNILAIATYFRFGGAVFIVYFKNKKKFLVLSKALILFPYGIQRRNYYSQFQSAIYSGYRYVHL